MTTRQHLAFQDLLSAWTRREDARSQGSFAELASARIALEEARAQMRIVTLSR